MIPWVSALATSVISTPQRQSKKSHSVPLAPLSSGSTAALARSPISCLFSCIFRVWRRPPPFTETNFGWTFFAAAWTTGWAYVVAVLFYQVATFARHPVSSGLWIVALAGVVAAVFALLRILGRRSQSVVDSRTTTHEPHSINLTGA